MDMRATHAKSFSSASSQRGELYRWIQEVAMPLERKRQLRRSEEMQEVCNINNRDSMNSSKNEHAKQLAHVGLKGWQR